MPSLRLFLRTFYSCCTLQYRVFLQRSKPDVSKSKKKILDVNYLHESGIQVTLANYQHKLEKQMPHGKLKTKILPESQGHRAALISVSVALSQTPAEAANPQTRG